MSDFYAVYAPQRCRLLPHDNTPLGRRRWFRWQVVRETRPYRSDEFLITGYEHHSLHWTGRSAHEAADRAQLATQVGGGE